MGIDLWNPHANLAVPAALLTAFLLGIMHGITPDEHTWPITFSYAIGSYSTRRGLLSGLLFSAAFTVQRALGSVLAYLALARWMQSEQVDSAVYVAVGVVMALAGVYILRLGRVFHLHLLPASWSGGAHLHRWRAAATGAETEAGTYRPVTPWMAVMHGFIAGWGVGAFATILYTTLAPAMPNVAMAWIPGALFGLGTLVVQAVAGAAFGAWMHHHHLPEAVIAMVGRGVAGSTLLWGGMAFTVAGMVGLLMPALVSWQITTPIQVHNLHHLGVGFVLVVLVVAVIGMGSLLRALGQARRYATQSDARASADGAPPAIADGQEERRSREPAAPPGTPAWQYVDQREEAHERRER